MEKDLKVSIAVALDRSRSVVKSEILNGVASNMSVGWGGDVNMREWMICLMPEVCGK
jgi:hypothetical protein